MEINYEVDGSLQEFLEKNFPFLEMKYIIQLYLTGRPDKAREDLRKNIYYYNDASFFHFSSAFSWESTTEGHAFWKKVDLLWTEYILKYKVDSNSNNPSRFGFYKERVGLISESSELANAVAQWSNDNENHETFNKGVI
jgi:hypothetical protein